jgi:hypothetical protein
MLICENMQINFFKVRTFIDSLAGLFKTRVLCSVTFSETDACDEITWKFLLHQTAERIHYTRNTTKGFAVLDN